MVPPRDSLPHQSTVLWVIYAFGVVDVTAGATHGGVPDFEILFAGVSALERMTDHGGRWRVVFAAWAREAYSEVQRPDAVVVLVRPRVGETYGTPCNRGRLRRC